MSIFFDDRMIPTNWFVVGLLIVLFIITFMGTIFAGKAMTEGMSPNVPRSYVNPAMPGGNLRFVSETSGTGQERNPAYESFAGNPEPPVFYDIGNINMARADRANVKPDTPSEGYLDPNRWNNKVDKFTDEQLASTL